MLGKEGKKRETGRREGARIYDGEGFSMLHSRINIHFQATEVEKDKSQVVVIVTAMNVQTFVIQNTICLLFSLIKINETNERLNGYSNWYLHSQFLMKTNT